MQVTTKDKARMEDQDEMGKQSASHDTALTSAISDCRTVSAFGCRSQQVSGWLTMTWNIVSTTEMYDSDIYVYYSCFLRVYNGIIIYVYM